ncbi:MULTISPECIES: response regulator [Marinobacter]|uniref:response regulator n=1 Tax=Marinobacter TaxID=2742 RepID=UPI000DAC1769|nr:MULTISPECIES: response regulator [Marinobacter]
MADLQRVLYVEDEPDIRAVAELALEAVGGFTVKLCASGEQALAEAEDFSPQLILLDVMMPGMDGPETLRALRQRPALEDVPVVFMTAKVQPAELDGYLALGAAGTIPKPFDPMTLADSVRTIWQSA